MPKYLWFYAMLKFCYYSYNVFLVPNLNFSNYVFLPYSKAHWITQWMNVAIQINLPYLYWRHFFLNVQGASTFFFFLSDSHMNHNVHHTHTKGSTSHCVQIVQWSYPYIVQGSQHITILPTISLSTDQRAAKQPETTAGSESSACTAIQLAELLSMLNFNSRPLTFSLTHAVVERVHANWSNLQPSVQILLLVFSMHTCKVWLNAISAEWSFLMVKFFYMSWTIKVCKELGQNRTVQKEKDQSGGESEKQRKTWGLRMEDDAWEILCIEGSSWNGLQVKRCSNWFCLYWSMTQWLL